VIRVEKRISPKIDKKDHEPSTHKAIKIGTINSKQNGIKISISQYYHISNQK